jgi:hypothetical protein
VILRCNKRHPTYAPSEPNPACDTDRMAIWGNLDAHPRMAAMTRGEAGLVGVWVDLAPPRRPDRVRGLAAGRSPTNEVPGPFPETKRNQPCLSRNVMKSKMFHPGTRPGIGGLGAAWRLVWVRDETKPMGVWIRSPGAEDVRDVASRNEANGGLGNFPRADADRRTATSRNEANGGLGNLSDVRAARIIAVVGVLTIGPAGVRGNVPVAAKRPSWGADTKPRAVGRILDATAGGPHGGGPRRRQGGASS